MATPEFIERDVNVITAEMIADYEQRTGRTLQPAQVERLLINAFAYREALIREKVQYAAIQNLVEFSNAPVLDELGKLVGVTRLPASYATTIIRLDFTTPHSEMVLPAGMRIGTDDGKVVFTLDADQIVAENAISLTAPFTATEGGAIGNGYASGTITVIKDPQPNVSDATNTTVSSGGANQESDEELRDRIKLAPSAFSNAGSKGAYKYWAKSANPSIIDVAVLGTEDGTAPGEVQIYPLMADGSVPGDTVIDQVYAACNDEKVRPLTDLVNVFPPDDYHYDIEVSLTLFTDADPTDIESQVYTKLNAFALAKRQSLGQDIKITQIISQCMVDGVFDVSVDFPMGDIVIDAVGYGFCDSVTVNISGTTNG